MKLRVLFLEDDENVDILKRRFAKRYAEIELEITALTRDEVWNPNAGIGGRYRVSARSIELARDASPELYDAIVIGNNMGTGIPKARALPATMREVTFIAFNEYRPDIVFPYTDLGFSHFGQRWRYEDETEIVSIVDFLAEIAENLTKV